jgi:hypothetical protein
LAVRLLQAEVDLGQGLACVVYEVQLDTCGVRLDIEYLKQVFNLGVVPELHAEKALVLRKQGEVICLIIVEVCGKQVDITL